MTELLLLCIGLFFFMFTKRTGSNIVLGLCFWALAAAVFYEEFEHKTDIDIVKLEKEIVETKNKIKQDSFFLDSSNSKILNP